MSAAAFDKRILKAVSRSFYLSIRILPRNVQVPIGIAYMLARTSDTIADTESVPVDTRVRRLDDFHQLLKGQPSPQAIANIQRDIQPDHPGERRLIAALPDLLRGYSGLSPWDWNETSDLMNNIIRAQRNDILTFQSSNGVVALQNAAELEDYIYLVAGCVGEWWTAVCYHHLPNYSDLPEDELTTLSDAFGKALQLVNILRDIRADLAAGRCYLPADELAARHVTPGELRDHPELAQPVVDHWLARARSLLEKARIYIAAVRVRRIRLACYLPWRLAGRTLDLLERQSPLTTPHKLKVPRSVVRSTLWEGLRVACSSRAL